MRGNSLRSLNGSPICYSQHNRRLPGGNAARTIQQQLGIGSIYALFTSLILTLTPVTLLYRVNRISHQVNQHLEEIVSRIIISERIEQISQSLSASGVRVLPRIHSKGLVTLPAGPPLLLTKNSTIRPDSFSDAISWIETDFARRLIVHSRTETGGFYACFSNSRAQAISREIDSYIAITRDGNYEVRELFPHTTGTRSCLTLSLSAQESLIADSIDTFFPAGTLYLVPIIRIGSLYRDQQGTLRYVGHSGTFIIENQPIHDNIPPFRLTTLIDEPGLVTFDVQFYSLRDSFEMLKQTFVNQLLPPNRLTLLGNHLDDY